MREGVLLTPPPSCGLQPGTLRVHLLREGRAQEATLRLADFEGAELYMGDSVRGLVRGVLRGRQSPGARLLDKSSEAWQKVHMKNFHARASLIIDAIHSMVG